jgi:protease-4
MKLFLKMLVAVLIAQILIVAVVGIIVATKVKDGPRIKNGSVLVQVLDGKIPESQPQGGVPFIGPCVTSYTEILENLEKARHDERIKAVVLRIGSPAIGWAKAGELRERIAQLRAAEKQVWAYTEWLGSRALYLGAACDSLFLLRNGYVSLRGFAAEVPFIKGTLDKLGVQENLHRIEHYKSAAEILQRETLSPTARENVEWMLDEFYPEYLQTVEEERGLAPGTLESSVLSQGILVPAEALELGLVDGLVYWDEVETGLLNLPEVKPEKKEKEGIQLRPRTVSGNDYAGVERKKAGIKVEQKIAVVHAMGMIAGEESGVSFPFGATMGSATMERAFRSAAEDEDIAAIIFRIDSGGGEANPLSVVGSIGSISGKFNMHGLYDKLGITKDFVTRGPNALMESDYSDYSPEQWESFTSRHWRDYQEWVDDIARFRHKTPAEIDSVGRGRVWSGRQALAVGLIDTLGTFDLAVRIAKQKAGIPEDEEVEFVHYPKKKGPLEALRSGGFGTALLTLAEQVLGPFEREGTWAVDWNNYR